MEPVTQLCTERLVLRTWRDADLPLFAQLNADPEVMAHYPAPLTREESDAMVARIGAHFEKRGFGLWAVELPGVAPFIGFIGLIVPRYTAHFTPCVEIGWRLATAHQGKGYATEGAREAVRFAFEQLDLPELVAVTVPPNFKSRRVMEKLGMTHRPEENFDHPLLPAGSPLREHVLYRLQRGR